MKYEKPEVVAQTGTSGSFAAGCPAKNMDKNFWSGCKACERTQ